MARRTRSKQLETRTARLRLPPRRKPYFQPVSAGIAVGYRRNATEAGTWSVRAAAGDGTNWLKKLGVADDIEDSDGGAAVLTFWQAVDAARALARAGDGQNGDKPATIAEALDAYEHDLRARGGAVGNVSRVRYSLPTALAAKPVATLTARDLRGWRNRLVTAGMAAASADRTARALAAALSLAARDDARIVNSSAWKDGLQRLPDSERARANVVLDDDTVRALVTAAYGVEWEFGVLVEVLAICGSRAGQVLRLKVGDLEDAGPAPRIQMPTSRKGRRRKIEYKPLPIPVQLAGALRTLAAGRSDGDQLLTRAEGKPWPQKIDKLFRKAVTTVGLDAGTTPYCLRHSSITRALLAGAPIALVASSHDTSPAVISRHYAKYITDNSDTLLRKVMLNMSAPAAPNVIPLAGRK